MPNLPDRQQLETMADQANSLAPLGKLVSESDTIELKAAIWANVVNRRDAYASMITPVLEHLERTIRAAESEGFEISLIHTKQDGLSSLTADITPTGA